jgi:DNA-binding transcriptional LysR family regulator
MELHQLCSFIAVAEELHFGHAATRLHLAQSALSRQIQQLEREFKFQLFFRTKRRVQLTAAGSVFLDQVRPVFAQLNDALEAASRVARGRIGWLSIGFVGGATYDVLPAIVRAFRQRSPEVELTLSEMTTTEQLDALREKRVHIGFVRPPVSDEGLALETIMHEPIAVALPRGHRLARRRDIPLRALAREPFILFPHNPKARWGEYMVNLCRQAGFQDRPEGERDTDGNQPGFGRPRHHAGTRVREKHPAKTGGISPIGGTQSRSRPHCRLSTRRSVPGAPRFSAHSPGDRAKVLMRLPVCQCERRARH